LADEGETVALALAAGGMLALVLGWAATLTGSS
jgi:hypothetical protein